MSKLADDTAVRRNDDPRVKALSESLSALQTILQEVRHLYAVNRDFDYAGELRQRMMELMERIAVVEMLLHRAEASDEMKPPSDEEVERQTEALRRLDAYVRDDQNIHNCITYLMQIAACFR